MQQTKSYWRMTALTAVAGVVIAFVGSACTVTTTSDDGGAAGDIFATAGATNTFAGAGGADSAGAAAIAGAAGAAKVAYECTPDDGTFVGTQNTCAPAPGSETDKCALCVQSKCCTEYGQCYGTEPGNQCGWGGKDDNGEIVCIQTCIQTGYMQSGVYDADLVSGCASGCATNPANGSAKDCGAFIGQQTSDLVACLDMNCQGPCFTGEDQ